MNFGIYEIFYGKALSYVEFIENFGILDLYSIVDNVNMTFQSIFFLEKNELFALSCRAGWLANSSQKEIPFST